MAKINSASPLAAKEGFLFGCDPELFVFNPEGIPVPADMIPGSKLNPHAVENGAVQRDGFAAEFNIDPVDNFADWNRNISSVLAQLEGFLPKGYTLRAQASVRFPQEIFDAADDDVKELGCSPDFDAWTGMMNPPPGDPSDPYLRCAAGHIHFGWTEGALMSDAQHILNCRDLVRQLDWYLAGWSLRHDSDPERRRLYGRAGACRFKSYGVEYRVLSNFWVTSEEMRLAVWNRMNQAIHDMRTRFMPERALSPHNDMLIEAINSTTPHAGLEAAYKTPLTTIDKAKKSLSETYFEVYAPQTIAMES